MLAKSLRESPFFQLLVSRESSEPNAKAYEGLLLLTEPDAEEALEYIKSVFPGFTSHDMGHSLRILENLYLVLSDALRDTLSASEIFCLMMAAMFHDMGMAEADAPDQSRQRDLHHLYVEKPLKLLMETRMASVREWRRLYNCILFVCQAHGMELGVFYGHKDFYTHDSINGKPLRFGLLGVLLRIGDLLDLDENRTSEFIRKLYPSHFQDETSLRHHCRHEHIDRFAISPQVIDIRVLAADVEEYHIWDRWLHYLKEDILHANTYLMPKLGSGLALPELKSEIDKTEGAAFETEELRFELTDEGQIWNILAKSVYTGEFDFIRELVQNGIDAVLMKDYQTPDLELAYSSPRSWGAWERDNKVTVAYSAAQKLLLIWDTGIGMDSNEVRSFLFRIADSGYQHSPKTRNFPLYTIAKFGIGFISCLSKCEEIVLYTYPASMEEGCRVRMYSNSTHAYFEKMEAHPVSGTTICMHLKRSYKAEEIREYLAATFCYPSVPVQWLELDQMEQQLNDLNRLRQLRRPLAFASGFQIPHQLFEPDYDFFELVRDKIFTERRREEQTVGRLTDQLKEHLAVWRDQDQSSGMNRKKFEQEMSVLLRDIQPLDKHSDFRKRIGQRLSESKKWTDKQFSLMAGMLLSQIQGGIDGLESVRQQLNAAANIYIQPRWQIGRSVMAPFWEFDACLMPLEGDFIASTMVIDPEKGRQYVQGAGLLFVQCAFDDWALGVEWRSIHGFLFQDQGLTLGLVKVGEKERARIEENYGLDLAEALDSAYPEWYKPEELLDAFLEDHSYQLGQALEDGIDTSLYYLDVTRERITRREISRTKRREVYMGYYSGGAENEIIDYDLIKGSFIHPHLSEIPEAAAVEEMYRTKSHFYQDGIPLDMDPSGLVPLGMCRVRVNLSGRARMELNVTRRYVDESQAKLDAWLADVGRSIQQRVIEQLQQTIQAWGIQGDLYALCTEGEHFDKYLDRHSLSHLANGLNESTLPAPPIFGPEN